MVSGHGPYRCRPPKYYFRERATPQFHSEMGMPNIVTMDSLKLMMPEAAMWPQGALWGVHDFTARGRAERRRLSAARIEKMLWRRTETLAEWVELAQFVNYEGHRAMFEAQSKNRMGLLIWMSHSCWPSMVWQTYDYYLRADGGVFRREEGDRAAAHPVECR